MVDSLLGKENNMEDFFAIVVAIFGVIVLVTALAVVLAFPFMWCWNYVMPYLFGLKTIEWLQAWCLMFVSGCLFKSNNVNNK